MTAREQSSARRPPTAADFPEDERRRLVVELLEQQAARCRACGWSAADVAHGLLVTAVRESLARVGAADTIALLRHAASRLELEAAPPAGSG